MKITVKSLQGDEYIVEAENDQSVFDLKVKISEKLNGPAICRQKLVYKGTTMQESNKIGNYNLVDGCKVHLILKKDDTNMSKKISNGSFSTIQQANTSANSNTSISVTTPSPSSQCSMDAASSEINCNYNNYNAQSVSAKCESNSQLKSTQIASVNDKQEKSNNISQTPSRFEVILRERLAKHFDTDAVEKIMANIQHEIDADINSSSLDDLERMAKQKLNISNE